MKWIKQKTQAEFLDVPQPTLSHIYTGKRPVTWPQAERWAILFPEKDIRWFRTATPKTLQHFFEDAIFEQLNKKVV